MVSADTNLLVSLIARDDDEQVAQSEAFIENGAWVSHLVVAEAIWVLAKVYRRSTRDQIEILEMLLKHRSLIIEDPETVAAAVDLFRAKPRLRFSDCLIFEISKKAGHLPLGTFDRGFSSVEGAELI